MGAPHRWHTACAGPFDAPQAAQLTNGDGPASAIGDGAMGSSGEPEAGTVIGAGGGGIGGGMVGAAAIWTRSSLRFAFLTSSRCVTSPAAIQTTIARMSKDRGLEVEIAARPISRMIAAGIAPIANQAVLG